MRNIIEGFPASVRMALEPVLLNEKVKQVILFGSRAFGDADDRSDFDIAISGPNITRAGLVGIWEDLEKSNTLYKISISHLEPMPRDLRNRVLTTGIIIHERA